MSVDQNVLIPEATPTVVVIDEAKEQQEREEIEKVRQEIINKTIFLFILMNSGERQQADTFTLIRCCTPIPIPELVTMFN